MTEIRVLLADDDQDDRLFFEDALDDLGYPTRLMIAKNGMELMDILNSQDQLVAEILFLDLNMPLKNGVECLSEIRSDPKFDELLIVIYSTSMNQETVKQLYQKYADYYIQKPADYEDLKKVIKRVLDLRKQTNRKPNPIAGFIITPV